MWEWKGDGWYLIYYSTLSGSVCFQKLDLPNVNITNLGSQSKAELLARQKWPEVFEPRKEAKDPKVAYIKALNI